jgi:hypothetical protein
MRKRMSVRSQDRLWNYLTREMARAAREARPRCGCPVNAPEADPEKFPCPCGSHCQDAECKRLNKLMIR